MWCNYKDPWNKCWPTVLILRQEVVLHICLQSNYLHPSLQLFPLPPHFPHKKLPPKKWQIIAKPKERQLMLNTDPDLSVVVSSCKESAVPGESAASDTALVTTQCLDKLPGLAEPQLEENKSGSINRSKTFLLRNLYRYWTHLQQQQQ